MDHSRVSGRHRAGVQRGRGLEEVWCFIDKHMSSPNVERPIVLMDHGGATIAEIWDSSLYFATGKRRAKCEPISTWLASIKMSRKNRAP